MPRRENSLPAPPSGKAHRPAPRKIHPRRQHDSRRDAAWRVSTRAPKCYNTQPEHLRAQANLGVSFLETQNRVNRPCSALICNRNFALAGSKPALISKGLRRFRQLVWRCQFGFQTSPDFKGIKTLSAALRARLRGFQTSPDFKGIKTAFSCASLRKFSGSKPALISKGLRPYSRLALVMQAGVPNQP